MVRHKLLSEMHPHSPSTTAMLHTQIGGHTFIMAHTAALWGMKSRRHTGTYVLISHLVGLDWPVIMQATVPYQVLPYTRPCDTHTRTDVHNYLIRNLSVVHHYSKKKKRKESPTESILEEMSVVPFSEILREINRRDYQQHDLRKVSTMDFLYELHDRSVKLKEVIEYQRRYPEPHYDLRKAVRSDLDKELHARLLADEIP